MNNRTIRRAFLILAMGSLLIVGSVQSGPKEETKEKFKAKSPIGCRISSWEPEVYSFYGDSATIMPKLERFEMNLPNRRIYMFMVESDDSAQISLFELDKDSKEGNKFHVWNWKGKSAGHLREKATNTILANRGVACVGRQIKALVETLKPEDKGAIPAPSDAPAAFGHVIQEYGKEYIRVTVFLLC